MREITQIENFTVEILRRSYQRSMNLTVKNDGRLRVTCGRKLPQREIFKFVRESEPFIAKRLLEIEELRRKYPPKQFLSGETFWFFGEERRLDVIWGWSERLKVNARESSLEMLAPLNSTPEGRAEALRSFYKKQARLHFDDRLHIFSKQMGLMPSSVSVRGQKTRWGSCSGRGEISLNWKLIAAPLAVIDYVVIHELAHLQHHDHSPAFWRLVGIFHPEYKRDKRWLREHEFEIAQQFAPLAVKK